MLAPVTAAVITRREAGDGHQGQEHREQRPGSGRSRRQDQAIVVTDHHQHQAEHPEGLLRHAGEIERRHRKSGWVIGRRQVADEPGHGTRLGQHEHHACDLGDRSRLGAKRHFGGFASAILGTCPFCVPSPTQVSGCLQLSGLSVAKRTSGHATGTP